MWVLNLKPVCLDPTKAFSGRTDKWSILSGLLSKKRERQFSPVRTVCIVFSSIFELYKRQKKILFLILIFSRTQKLISVTIKTGFGLQISVCLNVPLGSHKIHIHEMVVKIIWSLTLNYTWGCRHSQIHLSKHTCKCWGTEPLGHSFILIREDQWNQMPKLNDFFSEFNVSWQDNISPSYFIGTRIHT